MLSTILWFPVLWAVLVILLPLKQEKSLKNMALVGQSV